MTLISYFAAFIVICMACYTDIKRFEISNKLCIATMMIGILFSMLQLKMPVFWWTVASTGGIFIMLLLLYIAKGLGAGDVKFLSSLTFLVGAQEIWVLILIAFVLAGLIAVLLYTVKGTAKLSSYLTVQSATTKYDKLIPLKRKLNLLANVKQIPFMIAVLPAFILLCFNEVIQ